MNNVGLVKPASNLGRVLIETAYTYSDDRSLLLVAMKPNPFSSKVCKARSYTKQAHAVHR